VRGTDGGELIRKYLLIASVMLVACGGDATEETVDPNAASINVQGFSFGQTPAVTAGETINIINQDSTRHTFTSPEDAWDEVNLPGNSTTAFTVPDALTPGSYLFICAVHPDSMGGRLTVEG
jgi:plastocyanin